MNVDGYLDCEKASQNSAFTRPTARPYRMSW